MLNSFAIRRLLVLAAAVGPALATLQACGSGVQYDPTKYVCWNGDFLCPILAGEPLKQCGNACYSSFQYACNGAALSSLPTTSVPVSLTVWNPTLPAIHNQPVSACGLALSAGGSTCSYCPSVVPPADCPAGTNTVIYGSGNAMDVEVPGGQQLYLNPAWTLAYTQAHSASIPSGSLIGGLVACQGGGFINNNVGALGWVACPPAAAGGAWALFGINATSQAHHTACSRVQLQVHNQPNNVYGAWQYT